MISTARVENLEARVANLETELTRLKKIDAKMTVREICKTLERHICAEAVGGKRARSEDICRFFLLQGSDFQEVKTLLGTLGLTTGFLYIIGDLGNNVAYEDGETITVPMLRSLINNPDDYQEMKDKKQKFIEALYRYKMVDDKERVQTFFAEKD